MAILDSQVTDGEDLDSLRRLHEGFENERPAWRDRIEVLYISRAVLATFDSKPEGVVARISPGEPLHLRDLEGRVGWYVDWHAVVSGGAKLFGPPPAELGPAVSRERFLEAVRSELAILSTEVRANTVAYVPAQQGYIVATVCRGLYALERGQQTSKENAVAWFAERHPEESEFVWAAYHAYRADIRGPHQRLVSFVDRVAAEADQLA